MAIRDNDEVRFPLFRGLNPAELESIEELCEIVRFGKGETIFREGDEAQNLHLVRKGRIALRVSVPNAKSITVYTVEPGEMVGWSAFSRGKKYTASGVASGEVEAIRIRGDDLTRLFGEDNRMGMVVYRQLIGVLSERLEESRSRLVQMLNS